MIGRTLGRYEILALIGRGGMGEVYRARDKSLDRDIALKLLPAEMADDPVRLERFQREAKTVAALNHPHIVHIYSVEEVDGVRFLTMELVEGDSLDHLIQPGGLPLARVFDIGIAVADGLATAHEKGIVHRDLKPANVMITKDGRAKVLDFGLAKLATAQSLPDITQTSSPLTTDGQVMGTVPYMSPEQLRGQNVEHRSDIFSLGVMLYEMATGVRPFTGASNSDITSAILRDTPASLDQVKPELPRHLARIVSHCLEKDAEQRAQSAKDVRNELTALRKEVDSGVIESHQTRSAPHKGRRNVWFGVGALVVVVGVTGALMFARTHGKSSVNTSVENTIAVLPFVNMSADKEQEYFSDGISEELLNLLARIPQLKVVARTSSFSFKGKDVEVPEIARQLKVSHVLEGSVRRNGNQVRIMAQLVHAADGYQVWSQTYDRTLDDVFKIQDEIAADVVRELKVTLLGTTPTVRATDPGAYAEYLQAVQLGRQFSRQSFARSDSLLRHVVAVDPNYAPAWLVLSANALNESTLGLISAEEGLPRAREASNRALAIDPNYAPPHAMLGVLATIEGDLRAAAAHVERGMALDPSDPYVLRNSAQLLANLGRTDEALAVSEEVARRDPVSATTLLNLAVIQRYARHFDDSIATNRTLLGLSPQNGVAHYNIGVALLFKGNGAGALAEFRKEPSDAWRMIGLPMAYHVLGQKADADTSLASLVKTIEKDGPYNIAFVYAFCGDADQAFAWLDKALKYEDPGITEIVAENLFDPIHSDPRWLPFLRKIGRAPEQLQKIEFKVTLPAEAAQ